MSERVRPRGSFVALLDKPLVHFLLLGSAVFWMRIALAQPDTSDKTIQVTPAIRSEVRRELEAGLGRKATSEEYQTALTRWKLDEVAYREALRLRLNQGDPVIRRQLITKYFEVNLKLQPLPEPSEKQLSAWLAAHRADYVPPKRYDFEQVFAQGSDPAAERRARGFVRALNAGADPNELGDEFHFGRTFLGRSPASIEVEFDARFARELVKLKPGEWALLPSKYGWHAVRVDRQTGGRLPERSALHRMLYRDYREHARQESFQRQLKELEGAYRFEAKSP